ncbi:hypothetical protein [Acidisphaera sp. L21]|uniref:hypothetical protein n=1 Tax=Acidisphaera sp. L21 TaxID=1641851 RepID=UPI00131C58C7|nr:hypothetical protein [Acidisphaera sp. L21]
MNDRLTALRLFVRVAQTGSSDGSPGHVDAVEGRLVVTANEGVVVAALAGPDIMTAAAGGCTKEVAAGQLVRLLPDWDMGSVELHAVFASGKAAKPGARAFADFLVAKIGRARTAPRQCAIARRRGRR